MKLKRTLSTLALLIGAYSVLLANDVIQKFIVDPGFNRVTLKWECNDENGVREYEIQRGISQQAFDKLTSIARKTDAQQDNKYSYVDHTVFKSTTSSRTFYYRIKVIKEDQSFQFSQVERVSPTISSARQTWGSIKAMFR